MSDEPPPHLRVVSERSPEQISKEIALQDLQWALRSMTANLLRVTRGAGKPWEVLSQTVDLINAFQRYRDAVGLWPTSYEVTECVRLRDDYDPSVPWSDRQFAHDQIVSGALQLAASTLLGQHLQISAGKRELSDGVNSLIRAREEENKRWEAARRAEAAAARAATVKKRKPIKRTKKPQG